jgi:hypothetical protein
MIGMIEITGFTKVGGPLTKRIALGPNGKPVSDGSACVMGNGAAKRLRFASVEEFASHIGNFDPNEAIALGALRPGLPDEVEIVPKARLERLHGAAGPNVIARIAEEIRYCPQCPGLALLDFDTKGMPGQVAARLQELGGFWPAMTTICPELKSVARVMRRSTSAGLYRSDTGEQFGGSGGLHVYLLVADAADIERFLGVLHARCWLAGLGWMMVGAGGQLLERSIVDRMVGGPERLVFEGAPVLEAPLAQDRDKRKPIVRDGSALDTLVACPPLTIAEQAELKSLRAKEAHRLAPERTKAREYFIAEQTKKIIERTGSAPHIAAAIVERQCKGILRPDVVLPFDDPVLNGTTVAQVLADPALYEGATLADPLEGVEYGRCKARIMRWADGAPWIHSFAHGRTVYELKFDAASLRAALDRAPAAEVADLFVRMALSGDLSPDELEELRDFVADRAGVGKRAIERKLKTAQQELERRHAEGEHNRRVAERVDPRPMIPAPAPDAPWLPQMEALNHVLGRCKSPEPPARDIDGFMAHVRTRRVPNMHALTSNGANGEEDAEKRLPTPEQPLLTKLAEPQLAELIERHIDYVDEGRSVHLNAAFVRHFHQRFDEELPIIAAIATLPLVLCDGTILAKHGLDRDRGIVFRIPSELVEILPQREDCRPAAVARAMDFLVNEWLCDVATDYTGRCILVATTLSIIERSLLQERPVFFVTAGRRGGGKTTTLVMLLMAATGVRPSAAAWSADKEERRKALAAYFLEGLPAIIWDNIPRGARISCPHIEKSCTTEFYSDRRLGVSEVICTSAATIQCFTGNNIGPHGDLTSRTLQARLEVDRADPENRPFRHPDPVAWTEANRGRILAALYTLLLANPVLRPGYAGEVPTRFKMWWRLVGSAVEHAAACHAEHTEPGAYDDAGPERPAPISFKNLFLTQEEDDEEGASLADALAALAEQWQNCANFRAADVVRLVNDQSDYRLEAEKQRGETLREFLFPNLPLGHTATAKAASNQLKRHLSEPVMRGARTFTLYGVPDPHDKTLNFSVGVK